MNGDLINRVKDGPFLDKQKNAKKEAASGKPEATSPAF